MKTAAMLRVGAVLIIGLGMRWVAASRGIGFEQLMLFDAVVVALTLAILVHSLEALVGPYRMIRVRVAEAVRAKQPRAIVCEGFAEQRDLARAIDSLMRLLEEHTEDPNLGPVYLHGGQHSGQRADSYIDESPLPITAPVQPSLDLASRPAMALQADPALESIAPHEPFRELFVSYAQALRQEERQSEVGSYQDFIAELDSVRRALSASHPGFDVLFFLGQGPQIRPRLVPHQVAADSEAKSL
jgi:hypothetical protein